MATTNAMPTAAYLTGATAGHPPTISPGASAVGPIDINLLKCIRHHLSRDQRGTPVSLAHLDDRSNSSQHASDTLNLHTSARIVHVDARRGCLWGHTHVACSGNGSRERTFSPRCPQERLHRRPLVRRATQLAARATHPHAHHEWSIYRNLRQRACCP